MIYHLRGEVVLCENDFTVLDVNGVGYKLTVSQNTLSHLTRLGERVCLYTHFYIREDALDLLGFYSEAELAAFRLLITVSGVGPKAAMAILSVMSPEKFALAVSRGDHKAIAKAQGVGAKTAARVVLELKDKVAKTFAAEADTDGDELAELSVKPLGNTEEAIAALMVLGYTRQESKAALKGVDPMLPLEAMITAALRKMSLNL